MKSLHEKFKYCTQKLRAIVVNLHRQTAEWIKIINSKSSNRVLISHLEQFNNQNNSARILQTILKTYRETYHGMKRNRAILD